MHSVTNSWSSVTQNGQFVSVLQDQGKVRSLLHLCLHVTLQHFLYDSVTLCVTVLLMVSNVTDCVKCYQNGQICSVLQNVLSVTIYRKK